jgi:hypothetical protein
MALARIYPVLWIQCCDGRGAVLFLNLNRLRQSTPLGNLTRLLLPCCVISRFCPPSSLTHLLAIVVSYACQGLILFSFWGKFRCLSRCNYPAYYDFILSTRVQYDDLYLYLRSLLEYWNTKIVSLCLREMVGRKYSLGWYHLASVHGH